MTRFLVAACALLVPIRAAQDNVLRVVFWKYPMPGQEQFYRDLGRDFEAAHPGMRVQLELQPWADAHASVRRWTNQSDGPDMAVVPDVWLAEFASSLERYPDQFPREFLDTFQPVMLERSRYHGANLGFVWAASTKALFYRTDLFEQAGLEPPATWDELVAVARRLNAWPSLCGLSIPGAPELDTADSFYLLLWSNGGELFDTAGHVRIDSPQALEALTFYRDLVLRYRVTEPDVTRCAKSCAEALFANGKAAMIETGPWGIGAFRSSGFHPTFAVAPLPKKRLQITQLVTDHLVLFRNSPRKSAALEFIGFAYQPSWRLRWARLGMAPELKTVASDVFFQTDPAWRVFISQLPNSHWIPLMRWEPMDRAVREMLVEIASGKIEPAAALKRLSRKMSALASSGRTGNGSFTRSELKP